MNTDGIDDRTVENVAQLLITRARRRPRGRIGSIDDVMTYAEFLSAAVTVALGLREVEVSDGSPIALIGKNSTRYLIDWFGAQLAGIPCALVDPNYPDDLVHEMLRDLDAGGVVWSGTAPRKAVGEGYVHATHSELLRAGRVGDVDAEDLPGVGSHPTDVVGFMHTSGTSGRPKFCAQSARYFVALGQVVARSFCLGPVDRVFAPLPLFHVNPLGYGIIGALTGYADALTAPRFSASRFWGQVSDDQITIAILHGVPVEILRKRLMSEPGSPTTNSTLRGLFFPDSDVMQAGNIPAGVSAYGSTEAGGITHTLNWAMPNVLADASRWGGHARHDIEWQLGAQDEILIRELRPGTIFSGYMASGRLEPALDGEGWFHTGDRGARGPEGELIFQGRITESIQSGGEFIPFLYVERELSARLGLRVCLGTRTGGLGDETVAYVESDRTRMELLEDDVRRAIGTLPRQLRPSALRGIDSFPRGQGIGKVLRSQLDARSVMWEIEL